MTLIHGELVDGTAVRVRTLPYEHTDLTLGVLLRATAPGASLHLLIPTLADVRALQMDIAGSHLRAMRMHRHNFALPRAAA
jgi:hypothetical protein